MPVLTGAEVLVLGASSQVGWFLLPRLIAAGARPVALSRAGQPRGFPDFEAVHWVNPGQLPDRHNTISHLVSAGPLPLALDVARDLTNLRSMSLTSSSSVLSKSNSPNVAERDMMASIASAEQALQELAVARGRPLMILRPTLLYGAGMDRTVSSLARLIARFGVMPISTRAGGMRQPLHVDDLAQALVAGLSHGHTALQTGRETPPLVSALCGGETLDYRAMVRRIFQALDRPPRFLPISPKLLAPALDALSRIGLAAGVNGEMVRRQAVNLVFDDQVLRTTLGLSPRRFAPAAQDFKQPLPERLQRLSRGV